MDIIQGLIEAGITGGADWRIVNNNGTFDVLNNMSNDVIFSILNGGSIEVGSNIYTNVVSNYVETSSVIASQWTTSGTKIYYNSGNIGIGTIDPITPLHIYNTSNARLLLDTTTTGTASVDFRRGTGVDMQNDYRFINDTNGYIKLQCENNTQSFTNTTANLAWFSSNETIIHKNTAMNGRVGIGTTYHTSRSLDVAGDANISGLMTTSNLSVSGSATITNSLSNTSLTIQNGLIPPAPIITPITNYISTITNEGTPSITYKTDTFTFNPPNLVAYYNFNNSSSLGLDNNPSSTKYNLTPTIVGGTGGYNSTVAISGGSFQATNDGDRLEGDFPLKSIFDNSTTGISVSCWFYKTSATYDNGYNTTLYRFYNPSVANQNITVSLAHYNNTFYYANFSFQYLSTGETYASGFGPLQAFNTWYHIVVILTNTRTIKVYINGSNITFTVNTYGGSAYPLPQCPNTTKLKIFEPYNSGAFSGNIDEFYIFNKELTQADVTSLYNKTYSLPSNTWNVNFPTSTSVIINNGSPQNVIGDYTVSLGNNSSVLPAGGQPTTPYPSTAITTIAIKYVYSTSASFINFVRGTTTDANHDYKVGNYNGEFKVVSSVSNVDTDYIKITTAGAISNPTGTASWNTGSDRRIKENIERASYDKCYENINRLELNRFNYIDGFNKVNSDMKQLGFIAQEVYEVFPKSVSSQGYYSDTLNIPDLLSIDITQINYSLYGAVKKLIEINNDDESILNTFDNRIKTIKTILNIDTEVSSTSNLIFDWNGSVMVLAYAN